MNRHVTLLIIPALMVLLVVSCHRKKEAVESPPAAAQEQKVAEVKKEPVKAEAPAAEASAFAITVEGVAVASGVTDRQPQGEADTFSIDAGAASVEVITWNRVLGAKEDLTIKHVYYLNGEKVDEIPLKVGSPNWRTWSRKEIKAEHTGDWKVEVVDPAGAVLASKSFVVSANTATDTGATKTE